MLAYFRKGSNSVFLVLKYEQNIFYDVYEVCVEKSLNYFITYLREIRIQAKKIIFRYKVSLYLAFLKTP